MLHAAVVVACLWMAGCGGTHSRSQPPASTRTSAQATGTRPAPGEPFFPTVNRKERVRLAHDGLVRAAPPLLRNACARTAEQTDWIVVCPTRVPGGRLAVSAFGVAGTAKDFGEGYELSLNSGALHDKGAPDPGHWTIAAGTPKAMRDQVTAFGQSAPLSKRRFQIGRVQVTRYREPVFGEFPGVYGGHVVYEWRQGQAVMQVSVHNSAHERVLRGLVRMLSRGPDPSPAAPPPR